MIRQHDNMLRTEWIYCAALKRLAVDFECLRVSLEIHPDSNRPDHIMKGTPLKSWYCFELRIGDKSFKGLKLNKVVDDAYKYFGKNNPGFGSDLHEDYTANT